MKETPEFLGAKARWVGVDWVRDLLLWRDVRRTGVAFGATLLLLLSLATLSAVTVLAHLGLALLSVTISLRVYKAVVQAVQKAEEGHPFR
ncbi:PREDICTED: reticulon-3-B-like, partial [Chaetura pelagica]|uniref:reticulon-3-B-like n=1 Tax=Chaetura pelagica TaxID=8897 RepID=UPI000523A0E4